MLHSLLAAVGKFNTATEFAKAVTVFDAIRRNSSASNNVQEETIRNYFQQAGLRRQRLIPRSECDLVSALQETLLQKKTFWKTKQIFLCVKTYNPLLRTFWKA